MDEEFQVMLADMPTTIRSCVCRKGDDIVIILNSKLADEQQQAGFAHEKEHIVLGDLGKASGADMIEIHAHRI